MRQQAKPFTVEVKKSRKSAKLNTSRSSASSQRRRGCAGGTGCAAVRTPGGERAQRPNGHNGQDGGHNGANGHGDVDADIARVFGGMQAQRPANRILPDLTAKPVVAPAEDEAPRQRRPRVAKSKAPRIPKPKPLPVTVREPVVRQEVPPRRRLPSACAAAPRTRTGSPQRTLEASPAAFRALGPSSC